jgi:hypothetical protein
MTKVRIEPGICGFTAAVQAEATEEYTVHLHVTSGCGAVQAMMKELGDTFSAFEVCLTRPGTGPFYCYAAEHFPVHAACPVIAGITKCIEAECNLALKQNAGIFFEE